MRIRRKESGFVTKKAGFLRKRESTIFFLKNSMAILENILNLPSVNNGNKGESSSGVEHHLAKVRVAGSNPVFRSDFKARVVELVDTLDLKSNGQLWPCGFKSRLEYSNLC